MGKHESFVSAEQLTQFFRSQSNMLIEEEVSLGIRKQRLLSVVVRQTQQYISSLEGFYSLILY